MRDFDSNDFFIFKFKYYLKNIGENQVAVVDNDLENDYKEATAIFRNPTWLEYYDISRKSYIGFGKLKQLSKKLLDTNKLKYLLIKIVDENGEEYYPDKDFINNLSPSLGFFLLEKTNEILDQFSLNDGLSKEEADELSLDCFKYYDSQKKIQNGNPTAIKVSAPSYVILYNYCQAFNLPPDVVRKISRKDLEAFSIIAEQKEVCSNNYNINNQPKPKVVKNLNKRR